MWTLSGQARGYSCPAKVCINNESFGIADTEELIASNDMVKHKIIFRQGYLEHTFYDVMSIGIADSDKNTIFFSKSLQSWNQGDLNYLNVLLITYTNM